MNVFTKSFRLLSKKAFGNVRQEPNAIGARIVKLVGNDTVLDIGAGILQAFGGRPIGSFHLCVDAFDPYLEHLRDKGAPAVMRGKAPDVLESFIDESWDTVLLIDLLEHLDKDASLRTLEEAERIARRQVIVFTPLGFLEQEAWEAWELPYNELQAHRCGFQDAEFKTRGYETSIHEEVSDQHGNSQHIFATWTRRSTGS